MNKFVYLGLGSLVLASAGVSAQTATNSQTSPSATAAVSNVAPLTDAQIAGVLQAANKSEAEAGVLAVKKAKNAEVKKFAQMMVDDHKTALDQANKLINDNKLKPQKGETSHDIKGAGATAKTALEKLSGAEFDKAYIDGQIAMHKDVLKTIDTQLLPAAKSAEVKALLQKMRPTIEAHMKHAQDISKKL